MDLTEFLRARLDEEDSAAKDERYYMPDADEMFSRARAVREVAAKRAIVNRCAVRINEPDQHPNGLVSPRAVLAWQILVDLAAVYSGHPDYRQEWA